MPQERMAPCESEKPNGEPCAHMGTFLVGVGQRRVDRQLACSRHVASVIIAMAAAEGKTNPQITVTWHANGVPVRIRGKEDW